MRERRVNTGVDNGKNPPSPFPTLHPRGPRPTVAAADAPAPSGPPLRPPASAAAAPTPAPAPPVDTVTRPERPPVPPLPTAAPAPAAPPRPAAQPLPPESPRQARIPAPPAAPPTVGVPAAGAPALPPAVAPALPPAPPVPGLRLPLAPPLWAPAPVGGYGFPVPAAPAPPWYRTAPQSRGRRAVAAVCLVLGLGLVGGAVAGAAVNQRPRRPAPPADGSSEAFAKAREVWRDTPVNRLFPPTVAVNDAGPGGADRSWSRVGVSAPAGCAGAFDPLLRQVLAPAGCARLLRATYVDSTSSTVTTVGLLVTSGEAAAMRALNQRWTSEHLGERTDLLPLPVAVPGTAAARFGPKQRGSWDVQVSADLPFVVYAVSGFADGRTVPDPQPADKADARGATSAPGQAGLGYDATGLASAVDDRLHATVSTLLHPPSHGTEK